MPVPQDRNLLVPQKLNFLVGWASSPPVPFSRTGKMPVPQDRNLLVPQKLNFLVGWASSPPVHFHEQARCLFHKT
ncbi:hypothetical protein [Microcoleus vaginatus]|uniref:hypothetical protein n=1 Tax=Microcoleus vaginatus TaxID=119532 RepID=UPI001F60B00C